MSNMNLLACRNNIEEAFKSLIQSGRPDIRDEENNDLIPQLYVDLFENNYILRQALDENHVIFKGRKGTGKSTVFLQAENMLKQNKNKLSVYINLQSCYEEIRVSNIDTQEELTRYNIYYNFFNEILTTIKKNISKIIPDKKLDKLFEEIHDGEYIDADFLRNMQVTTNAENSNSVSLNYSKTKESPSELHASLTKDKKIQSETKHESREIRILSINKILTKLKEILSKHRINKVYLFLDDFSELNFNHQKLVIDSLISPIITSYNDMFVIKLAAYPYRIYLGNIDS